MLYFVWKNSSLDSEGLISKLKNPQSRDPKSSYDGNNRGDQHVLHNLNYIDEKWRRRWRELGIYNVDPDLGKKKYFITVAYPYPNSPQHLGHGRTYTLADTHARYMRMKGYNVLFPMGFHYTGTPILAMSKRVASGDRDLIETFEKIYHVSRDQIAKFVEPIEIARFFHHEIKEGMIEMGYSIDWRREFTTIDTSYSQFISWQFRKLQSKGLIIQGSYPVAWCLNDQNAVSQHDTIGDIEPDFNEYVLVKFELDRGFVKILTATIRPETIYGVTNLWINPTSNYVHIQVNGKEEWIVSEQAVKKLQHLNYDISIQSTVRGKDLVGKRALDPVRHISVPIYPASFVDPNSGTGIVMSVPAHAPYDYQALEDLRRDIPMQHEFGLLDLDEVTPITIIDTSGHSRIDDKSSSYSPTSTSEPNATLSPAAQIIEKHGIKNQSDAKLQIATEELYSVEFYHGKMLQNTGKLAGINVSKAKEVVKKELIESGTADLMFELVDSSIRCRCGSGCVVKILKDQWFLNYANEQWKKLAHHCIGEMDIVPEDIRQEFNYVIDWLRERACARRSGLGTRIPWDKNWLIESLSDSVIYMAYYLLAKYINDNSIAELRNNYDHLKDSFFDYVFLGSGDSNQVAEDCNLDPLLLEKMRNEFCYFYPLDSRHSGRDLVPNHLSFFIFNHVAIFERKYWPRQIVVNGSILMEGKKMSKSLGNIIPLRDAIREYGADSIRLAMLSSAEILQDANFSFDSVRGIRSKLYEIYESAIEYSITNNSHEIALTVKRTELEDRWLISRLQRVIIDTTKLMDKLKAREALHNILYILDQDLSWYKRRLRSKNREHSPHAASIMIAFISTRIRLLAPFAPFLSEEAWEEMVRHTKPPSLPSPSIQFAGWPEANLDVDLVAEESELLIMNLLTDIQNILRVTKLIPHRIYIYTCAQWKRRIYQKILTIILIENKAKFGEIMKILNKDEQTAMAVRKNVGLIRKLVEDILSIPVEVRQRRLSIAESFDEAFSIRDATELLSNESTNHLVEIQVYPEVEENDNGKVQEGTKYMDRGIDVQQKNYDPKSRANHSRPFKPAVYIE
jgi:leucyl-tRNA synthetase